MMKVTDFTQLASSARIGQFEGREKKLLDAVNSFFDDVRETELPFGFTLDEEEEDFKKEKEDIIDILRDLDFVISRSLWSPSNPTVFTVTDVPWQVKYKSISKLLSKVLKGEMPRATLVQQFLELAEALKELHSREEKNRKLLKEMEDDLTNYIENRPVVGSIGLFFPEGTTSTQGVWFTNLLKREGWEVVNTADDEIADLRRLVWRATLGGVEVDLTLRVAKDDNQEEEEEY